MNEVGILVETVVGKDNHESQSTREEDRRDSDRLRSESRSRSRSSSRVSTNRDRIRCYKCREYDLFAIDCPNSITDEESDQGDLDQSTLQC